MRTHQFNFQNSSELLQELKKHRTTLTLRDKVELKNREISTKIDGINNLLEKKVPFEKEIAIIRKYYENGSYDRFAFRQASDVIQPELQILNKRIAGLEQDIQKAKWEIDLYQKLIGPAEQFLDAFGQRVYLYSQVAIEHNGQSQSFLIVPDIVRQKKSVSDIVMLARESELGSALFNQPIGTLKTSDRRFQNLRILNTKVASDLILGDVALDISEIDGHRRGKIQDRTVGGSMQRWQDGARDDYYIKCRNCGGLYSPGSGCGC